MEVLPKNLFNEKLLYFQTSTVKLLLFNISYDCNISPENRAFKFLGEYLLKSLIYSVLKDFSV